MLALPAGCNPSVPGHAWLFFLLGVDVLSNYRNFALDWTSRERPHGTPHRRPLPNGTGHGKPCCSMALHGPLSTRRRLSVGAGIRRCPFAITALLALAGGFLLAAVRADACCARVLDHFKSTLPLMLAGVGSRRNRTSSVLSIMGVA